MKIKQTKNKPIKTTILVVGLLLGSSKLIAGEAHEHGTADLQMALEVEQLQIVFKSPAMNLLGFEHAPQSDEEKQVFAAVAEQLKSPSALIAPAGCDLVSMDVDMPEGAEDDHDEHGDEEHEHHHADISASYVYQCSESAPHITVTLGLMQTYPSMQHLRVAWVSDQSQGGMTLTPEDDQWIKLTH